MAGSETSKLAMRSVSRRPAETVLLIIGIALGIGTTAGGISMVSHLKQEAALLVQSTGYREIVVSTREAAQDMEVPAYRNESDGTVILTGEDLSARDSAPDIQYAYTARARRVRIANFEVFNKLFSRESESGQKKDTTPAPDFSVPEYEGPRPVLEEITAIQTTPEFFTAYNIQPAQGSLFTQQEIDAQRPVVVVGSTLAEDLFEDGIVMGRELLVGRTLYEIIGVSEPTGTRYDNFAFYPSFATGSSNLTVAAMARSAGLGSTLRFTVYDAERLDEAKAQLESYFDTRYGSGAVVVRTPGTEAKESIDRNARLVTIILFLAVAGLLIAAVNVSNILYSRAMRKRKSVGILKALGATRKAVFAVFLGEALLVGMIGAVLGIGISAGFTRLLGDAFSSAALVSGPMLAGALGGFIITLGLTIIPALQASSIPAAEALRYE